MPLLRSGAEGGPWGFSSAGGGESTTFSSEDEGAVLASLGFSDNGSPTLVSLSVAPGPAAVASATPSSFSAWEGSSTVALIVLLDVVQKRHKHSEWRNRFPTNKIICSLPVERVYLYRSNGEGKEARNRTSCNTMQQRGETNVNSLRKQPFILLNIIIAWTGASTLKFKMCD